MGMICFIMKFWIEKAIKKEKHFGNNLEFFAINREKPLGFKTWHF